MSGTKPISLNIVRSFRGDMFYLASIHRRNGFRWVADRKSALGIATAEEAAQIAERASREFGAKCTVVDSHEVPHVIKRAPVSLGTQRAQESPRAATHMTNCSHGAPLGADCRECRADGLS